VVGGGIGGLCLAQALRAGEVRAAVYERDGAPNSRVDGYRLHINPAGARSLRACLPAVAWQDFLATVGRPGGGFGFLDDQLRTLCVVEDSIMYPTSDDPAERWYPVDRRTLRRLLLTELSPHFGKTLTRYSVSPSGSVTAFFADGTTAEGDVLVGADGAGSVVRQQFLPSATRVSTGADSVGLKLRLTPSVREWLPPRLGVGENMIVSAAPYFLFTSVFEPEYLLCAFVAREGVLPEGENTQEALAQLLSRWHPDLQRLIRSCDPDSVGRFEFMAAAPVTPWPSGPVTLLGDAVHSMPPTGGLGANTALRDARLLGQQLTAAANGTKPLHEAISTYETEMREYGFAAVRSSLTTLRQGLVSNPFATTGMRTWFRLSGTIPMLRRVGFRDAWNKDARARPWEQAV